MTQPTGQNDNIGDSQIEHEPQERLVHIHIEQDPLKPVTPERQHEQNVAIYDLLDENSFAVIDQTGPYHLYLKISVLDTIYGALASVILGFIWLVVSVSSLLLGAALSVEWSRRIADREAAQPINDDEGQTPE